MKFRLKANGELDLLTQGELRDELDRAMKNWNAELTRGTKFVRRSVTGVVNSSGSVVIGDTENEAIGPAPGMTWAVTRITTDAATQPRVTAFSDPAAGAQSSLFVDAGGWRVFGHQFTLTTDATVANRGPEIAAVRSAVEYYRSSATAVQAASLAVTHQFAPGGTGAGADATNGGLPPGGLVLAGGDQLNTSVAGLQAADQISGVTLWFSSLLDGLNAYVNAASPSGLVTPAMAGVNSYGDHELVLNPSDRLIFSGQGLVPSARVTVNIQAKETPYLMAWSL